MVAIISWVYSALNCTKNIILFCYYLHKYMNVAAFFKAVLNY